MAVKKLRVGLIGLGARGSSLLESVLLPMEDVEITAVCDVYEDRTASATALLEKAGKHAPSALQSADQLLRMPALDAVVICSSWETHIPLTISAMKAGVPVACEVGGAYSVEDCWQLVRAQEQSGTPFMFLENCCFGRNELMVLNMARQGLFGEIVHCQGGYRHDLREEVANGWKNRHYRLDNYLRRNCENYPTHELGPIAQVLNINRGNRMLALVSVASKAAGLEAYLEQKGLSLLPGGKPRFAQGDVITTIIRCAGGETIQLTLDTTLPRPYSRGFHIQGTKGMYEEDNRSIFLDGTHNAYDFDWKPQWNNIEGYRAQYEHPIWQKYLHKGVRGTHDGMDWLEFRRFFDCIKYREQPPLDVYDAASWMCISALSEESIAAGGAPVSIPDFTSGYWITRRPIELDSVHFL